MDNEVSYNGVRWVLCHLNASNYYGCSDFDAIIHNCISYHFYNSRGVSNTEAYFRSIFYKIIYDIMNVYI